MDEAWQYLNKAFPGHEYSATFLENVSRRIRKRNGGLTVASQKVEDFQASPQGNAIITNAYTTFLLNHPEADRAVLQKSFELDSGVVDHVINGEVGRVLIKQGTQLFLVDVKPFANEKKFVF